MDLCMFHIVNGILLKCVVNGISDVIIPEGTTVIANEAFYKCSKLRSVVIPDSVTYIGKYAFAHCTSLEEVVISKNVTVIPDYCFFNCRKLKKVIWHDDIERIGKSAFSDCISMTEIDEPAGLEEIDENAFYLCEHLEDIYIDCETDYSDVKYVNNYSYPEHYALEKYQDKILNFDKEKIEYDPKDISIDYRTVKYLKDRFSERCTASYDGEYIIVNNKLIKYKGTNKNVLVPDGVEVIAAGAFYKMDISSVKLPDSIHTIESCAFAFCDKLRSINDEKVSKIHISAYYGCFLLREIDNDLNKSNLYEMPTDCISKLDISGLL